MKSLELTYAIKGSTGPVACYYCLNDYDMNEVDQYTGGKTALATCPKCGIDSVVLKDELFTPKRLMAQHIDSFHFGCTINPDGDLNPDEPLTCGHEKCRLWDKYVKGLSDDEE